MIFSNLINAIIGIFQRKPNLPWRMSNNGAEIVPNEYGCVSFDFPVNNQTPGPNEVNYLMKKVNTPLVYGKTLYVSYRIDVTGNPRFIFQENPTFPATVSLWFQRQGDNYTGQGLHQWYRFWAYDTNKLDRLPLVPGTFTIAVPLTPDRWTGVYRGADSSEESKACFNAALSNVEHIGVTFGGDGGLGHGVNIEGGTAKFTIISVGMR